MDSCSKAGSTTTTSAVTYLAVIHGAPYTSAATIYLNDTLITQTTGIATGAFSPKYGTIRPGSYAVKFKKAGTDSILDQLVSSSYDTLNFYTLLLYNSFNSGASVTGGTAHVLKIWDDFSSVTSANAYYRFFNLAPDYPQVSVYFNGLLTQSNRTPADNAANDGFNKFQPMTAANYTITVKNAVTDSVIATSPTVSLQAGNAYTIWLSGIKSSNNSGMSINVLQAQY
ncbi:DUF4397 domain-containing protein [Puia dinghuensis]|uniref:DUF4397 domain-containing protein n=1 Tax=Puia dinghuensis TaxID=1792502 RepID=A0A8J2U8X0_9BACT|nr:DUF4397 domain-containing protein [Puia dinghuensis]GGA87416.1 hypothetical protein GCM10011511_08240 [Puia dinghuensis]